METTRLTWKGKGKMRVLVSQTEKSAFDTTSRGLRPKNHFAWACRPIL
jgi:hypothetical protein